VDVVDVVVVVAAVGATGSKTASNGDCIGLGSTTGTPLTVRETLVAPSSTDMGPVPTMVWLAPAASVPVHTVAPVDRLVAPTQHSPMALTVTWYGVEAMA
jgi:hypothetical protein